MYPKCVFCVEPAPYVCRDSKCTEYPFVCKGPCVANASTKVHSHSGSLTVISIEEYETKVAKFNNRHQEYLQNMRKRVDIIKSALDVMIQTHENDIRQKLNVQFLPGFDAVAFKIKDVAAQRDLTGKEIDKLVNFKADGGYYKSEVENYKTDYENLTEAFKGVVEKLEKGISGFVKYQEFKNDEKEYLRIIKQNKPPQESIENLKAIQKSFKFHQNYWLNLGHLYCQSNQPFKAQQSFLSLLQTHPQNKEALINLSYLYSVPSLLSQITSRKVIQYTTRAVQVDKKNNHVILNTRGACYANLSMVKQAFDDFYQSCKIKYTNEAQTNYVTVYKAVDKQKKNYNADEVKQILSKELF